MAVIGFLGIVLVACVWALVDEWRREPYWERLRRERRERGDDEK